MINLYKQILQKITESDQTLTEKVITLFERVRDIPYRYTGFRDPIEVYKNNMGTCSGKHLLLKGLYNSLGIEVKECLVMHSFNNLGAAYPDYIKKMFDKTEILDPHNFLKIRYPLNKDQWLTVDATWDSGLINLGFPVNLNWNGLTSMPLAVVQGGKISESYDSIALKKHILNSFTGQQRALRIEFLKSLTFWLETSESGK
jgi:hypothetical protein